MTSTTAPVEASQSGFIQSHPLINLDHGDPTMYESYWKKLGENFNICIPLYQSLSYFSNRENLCWFMEPKLEEEIKTLHNVVGNATVDGYHIVVGTGSSQLIQAAWYALAEPLNEPEPISVVSAAPYYSTYKDMADPVRSGLFKWGGDAHDHDKNRPYIEMVTSPNNPDGLIREAVINGAKGMVVHDLAYYWPQYTAITAPADHDIMMFTMSKLTGHAGSRIGWALVKDKEVAKKMVRYIVINTIGVSREAQLRAAAVIQVISSNFPRVEPANNLENFFEYGRLLMAERWKKLRDVVEKSALVHVDDFHPQYCKFTGDFTKTNPAFAWLKCNDGADGEKLFREHKILARSGRRFGVGADYVRISMTGGDEELDAFLQRLQNIQY